MKKKYTKEEWNNIYATNFFTFESPKVHIIYINNGKEVSEHRWKKTVHRTLWNCNWKLFFLIPVPCYCYRLEGDYYVRSGFHLMGRCSV